MPINHSEVVAKNVIEAVIRDARMEYCEDQSANQYDFDLHIGTVNAAVAVTMSTDRDRRDIIAAIMSPRNGGQFIGAKLCRQDWQIVTTVSSNIKAIRANADRYLANIEATGTTRFFSPTDSILCEPVASIYLQLGIEAGWICKWNPPGRICIDTPGAGGTISPDHLRLAVESVALKDDNRSQLKRGQKGNRHLFVYVDARHYLPWKALVDLEPPIDPPQLPEEIDVIWAATEAPGSVRDFAVVRADRSGWEDLGIVNVRS